MIHNISISIESDDSDFNIFTSSNMLWSFSQQTHWSVCAHFDFKRRRNCQPKLRSLSHMQRQGFRNCWSETHCRDSLFKLSLSGFFTCSLENHFERPIKVHCQVLEGI